MFSTLKVQINIVLRQYVQGSKALTLQMKPTYTSGKSGGQFFSPQRFFKISSRQKLMKPLERPCLCYPKPKDPNLQPYLTLNLHSSSHGRGTICIYHCGGEQVITEFYFSVELYLETNSTLCLLPELSKLKQ